ncbi:MAG: type II toxin-antitoxin system RelE/ParE family toxin [Bacteroidia bacterium]
MKYWHFRNKSKTYSKKLNNLFRHSITLLRRHAEIGKPTDKPNTRIKIIKDYLIFYKVLSEDILIIRIWDSRQNPENLKDDK